MTLKVLHVITDLQVGGAELTLYRLLQRRRYEAHVISLKEVGPVGARIQELGIPVEALAMRGGVPDPRGVTRLARRIRALRPNIVQTWMYHANLIGGLAAAMPGARRQPVLWNLRQSNLDRRRSKRSTILTAQVGARLSARLPRVIVCCSEEVRRVHEALGYQASRMVVIPNGVDGDFFKPDAAARAAVRAELDIPKDAPLIGLVGRVDPQKDHEMFIRAAAIIRRQLPAARFLLAGGGAEPDNANIAGPLAGAGLADCFHLLGRRDDVQRVHAALDLATSASAFGEGFPNAVAEAMACAVPCVVTDVGDSALLVGDTGEVVPPGDERAFAAACLRMLDRPAAERRALGAAARERILARYSMERALEAYESLYRDTAAAAHRNNVSEPKSRKS